MSDHRSITINIGPQSPDAWYYLAWIIAILSVASCTAYETKVKADVEAAKARGTQPAR